MGKNNYLKIEKFMSGHKRVKKIFVALYYALPVIVAGVYAALIAYMIYNKNHVVGRVIVVPALTFLIITGIRKWINEPRPYELYDINPIIKKDKSGQSFPSRHVLSASIIAMSCLYVNVWIGVALLIISAGIAVLRYIAGVHFLHDVIAGYVIGVIIGFIAFFI